MGQTSWTLRKSNESFGVDGKATVVMYYIVSPVWKAGQSDPLGVKGKDEAVTHYRVPSSCTGTQ